ncbi:MAG: MarR family winged helix-turn-helix transcriptional regulator [Candidatus Thorarchaeota archaeon]
MAKQKIHIAFFGNTESIECLTVRKQIDELIIVHNQEQEDIVNQLIDKYSSIGITGISVTVASHDFNNILSSSLNALDSQRIDEYDIEFSIATDDCTMTLAACISAAIVNASIVCVNRNETFDLSEIWPSELVNLSFQKREILCYLESCDKPVHQKQVAEETGIRPSGLSRHLRNLELAGYVSRLRISRRKHVSITELGRAVLHHKQIRKRRIWSSYTQTMENRVQIVG